MGKSYLIKKTIINNDGTKKQVFLTDTHSEILEINSYNLVKSLVDGLNRQYQLNPVYELVVINKLI